MDKWKSLTREQIIELHGLYTAPSFALTSDDWKRLKELSEAHHSLKSEQHSISQMNIIANI